MTEIHVRPRRRLRWTSCTALSIAAFATSYATADSPDPFSAPDASSEPLATERDRVLYAIGVRTAKELRGYALQPSEIDFVERGLRDELLGREVLINESAYDTKLNNFRNVRRKIAVEKEEEAAREFVARAAAEAGALVTDSGFVFFELRPGDGAQPRADSLVRIHFHGRLRDGTVWDSSVESGEPRQLAMARLFPCGRAGLLRMRVGGRSRMVCPPELAFGAEGTPRVPGGAAIDFEVELLAIVK